MGVIWVADAICEDQRDNARNAEESRDNILIILISHQYTVTNNAPHLPALASKIVYYIILYLWTSNCLYRTFFYDLKTIRKYLFKRCCQSQSFLQALDIWLDCYIDDVEKSNCSLAPEMVIACFTIQL